MNEPWALEPFRELPAGIAGLVRGGAALTPAGRVPYAVDLTGTRAAFVRPVRRSCSLQQVSAGDWALPGRRQQLCACDERSPAARLTMCGVRNGHHLLGSTAQSSLIWVTPSGFRVPPVGRLHHGPLAAHVASGEGSS